MRRTVGQAANLSAFPIGELMTQASAEKIANVIVGAAVIGAAYYVVKTPRLRRLAWRLTVAAVTGTLPAWLGEQIKAGWEASAPSSAAHEAPRGV
jgi:hypothetical protein